MRVAAETGTLAARNGRGSMEMTSYPTGGWVP